MCLRRSARRGPRPEAQRHATPPRVHVASRSSRGRSSPSCLSDVSESGAANGGVQSRFFFERAIEVRLRKIRAIARDLGWWDARFADRRPARIAVLPDQPGLAKRLVVLLEQPADGCHIEVSELFVHGLLENIPCCAD